MNDPTSAAWEELEEAFRQRGAELTRLRAQQTVLVDLLGDAIELIERERDNFPNRLLTVHLVAKETVFGSWPDKSYDIDAMRKALTTLDVPDTKEQT